MALAHPQNKKERVPSARRRIALVTTVQRACGILQKMQRAGKRDDIRNVFNFEALTFPIFCLRTVDPQIGLSRY
jgi:hypothetical protein